MLVGRESTHQLPQENVDFVTLDYHQGKDYLCLVLW